MNISKNKIIAGVIGLIAVVSLVNTGAIVKLSKNTGGQEAQVLSASRNCVEVLAPSQNRTSFIDAHGNISDQTHEYHIGIKIKNRCNYPISIISDQNYYYPGLVSNNVVNLAKVQRFPSLSNPLPSGYIVGTFTGPYSINSGAVAGGTADISIPIMGGGSMMYASTIQANSERDFVVYGYLNSTQEEQDYFRVSLDKFRWFRTSNFTSDNVLSQDEINTFTLSVDSFVSSYARFNGCTPGAVLGYDSQGNAIYCMGFNQGDERANTNLQSIKEGASSPVLRTNLR